MITPEELRALLKKHRWSIAITRSGRQQVYSAKQRQGQKIATRYIGTRNKLNNLSVEDVLSKLGRSTPLASTDEINARGGATNHNLDQEIGLAG